MTKPTKVPKASSPAAPGADAGTHPGEVGAGTHPAAGSVPAAGSAAQTPPPASSGSPDGGEPPSGAGSTDLRVHPAAVDAGISPDVIDFARLLAPDITDVFAARRYPDRWVLVVQSAKHAWKIEVQA